MVSLPRVWTLEEIPAPADLSSTVNDFAYQSNSKTASEQIDDGERRHCWLSNEWPCIRFDIGGELALGVGAAQIEMFATLPVRANPPLVEDQSSRERNSE